jgi:hypothetical protein
MHGGSVWRSMAANAVTPDTENHTCRKTCANGACMILVYAALADLPVGVSKGFSPPAWDTGSPGACASSSFRPDLLLLLGHIVSHQLL